MQGAGEDYSSKYDISTSYGLSFAIDSLAKALDPDRLRELGYSEEQIKELQESVSIASDQLTTQSNIEKLAAEAVENSHLSAEEQEVMENYIADILGTAEEYKNSSDALMAEANEKIATIDSNVATAEANIALIESYQSSLATGNDIQSIVNAIMDMDPPVVNVNIDINGEPMGFGAGAPQFATGGYTGNYEGLAYLHPNEYVIPGDKMIRTTGTDVPQISKLEISPIINVNHAMTQREYEEITERMLTAAEKSLRRRGLTLGRGGLQ